MNLKNFLYYLSKSQNGNFIKNVDNMHNELYTKMLKM